MSIKLSITRLLPVAAALLLLTGCNSKKHVIYFQDNVVDIPELAQEPVPVKVEPGDKLSIGVSSSDPELASVFNLNVQGRQSSRSTGGKGIRSTSGGSGGGGGLYTVDDKGNIDFPVLGEIHVAGLTRQQITQLIKNKLIAGKYVADPVVTVEFDNLHFTFIGEIGSPSVYSISDDHLNIVEAIAMAGDFTMTSERDKVYVIRTENGVRTTTRINLLSKDAFDSPVYYLKQNDIIYVTPNSKKTGEYSINENNWKSVGTYMGAFSFVVSVTSFVIALSK